MRTQPHKPGALPALDPTQCHRHFALGGRWVSAESAAVQTLRPWVKTGLVLLGLTLALVIGGVVAAVRDHFSEVSAVEKAGGMYGFGQVLLFIAASGVAALIPLTVGLIWMRPVEKFWRGLAGVAVVSALTGIVALGANRVAGTSTAFWVLLAQARIGMMPLTALALLACALIAPQPRHRWILIGAAACDSLIFASVFLVHFVIPGMSR